MTHRLSAETLTLSYGGPVIVDALSALIPEGKVTTIAGPNGCGKSTLLRALGRLMKPRGGRVLLDGQEIHQQSTKSVARRLGLLSQGLSAPEAITVEDLVSRGRYPHQSFFQPPNDEDHAAIERALELANMTRLRKRAIDELSGGQRQRAWIAMVLAQDTSILLLDEPTTYLDIAHQRETLALVRTLNEVHGKTIVMVLHDINEAARVSDHLVVMKAGQIVAEGSPANVVTPGLLRDVFDVEAAELPHPRTGRSLCVTPATVTPLRGRETGDALKATQVSLGYGDRVVASDLTVCFPRGQVSAIIGPNACGKTTLLRALGRLIRARSGELEIEGRPILHGSRRSFARDLAFLTQSPTTPMDITVRELVASGRFPHQRWWRQWDSADEQAVTDAIRATNMVSMASTPVASLSGGQRQRAWIAMALAQATPVLLLDEPTTFLDIAHQVDVLELVRRMNREDDRTVVMVLHDLQHACQYADYIVAMKDGAVVAAGSPADIVTPHLVMTVFGVEADVIPHPLDGTPLVIPVEDERSHSRAPYRQLAEALV